jgi:hypothetical protein
MKQILLALIIAVILPNIVSRITIGTDLITPLFARKVITENSVEIRINKRFKCVYNDADKNFPRWDYYYDGKACGYCLYAAFSTVYGVAFYAQGDRERPKRVIKLTK